MPVAENYQLQTDEIISRQNGKRPSLLLHCCCAPCSTYVLEYLCAHFTVTGLFFNPNIYPAAEYEKRLFWFKHLTESQGGSVEIMPCNYEAERFEAASSGLEDSPEGGERCTACFELRLRETAQRAKAQGYDYFCSTLSVSPHKNAEKINNIGTALEKELGVSWLPSDFKKREGYKRSIELSRKLGIYRQDYCGCKFSKGETN